MSNINRDAHLELEGKFCLPVSYVSTVSIACGIILTTPFGAIGMLLEDLRCIFISLLVISYFYLIFVF